MAPSRRSTSSTRFPESARRGSISSATWWRRDPEPPRPARAAVSRRPRLCPPRRRHVRRFGRLRPQESVLLELPLGRSPPQGAILRVLGQIALPRGPSHGFDERTWLRRHGVHVVLHGDRWRLIGRRGGLGGVTDRLR